MPEEASTSRCGSTTHPTRGCPAIQTGVVACARIRPCACAQRTSASAARGAQKRSRVWLTASQTGWCFGREGQLECPLENVDHPFMFVSDLDAAVGLEAAERGDERSSALRR